MNLTPIQTTYAHYRFRSRLEARWAVYFTLLGLTWQYEPEGFRMGSVCYLPDFAVQVPVKAFTPGLFPKFEEVQAEQVWVEVKPAGKPLSGAELVKIRQFASATAGQAIYVVVLGDPLEGTGRSFQLVESSVVKGKQVYLCGAAWDKAKAAYLVLHPLSFRYKASKSAQAAAEKARAWQFGRKRHA